MGNNLIIKDVNFQGSELKAVQDPTDGKIYVGVAWVCSAIGFNKDQTKSERDRIQSDSVLSKVGRKFPLATTNGVKDTLCIEIEFLPLWLAKINITSNMQEKYPGAVKALEDYQLKAKDVLAAAFLPTVSKPMQLEELIIMQAQSSLEMKKQLSAIEAKTEETNQRVDDIRNIVALNPIQWREDTGALINKIAWKLGGNEHISAIRNESYELLEARFGVNLKTRLTHKRRRMAEEGVCKSKRNKENQLDVIGDDKKLIEGYIAIVKELAIKYEISA